jgi:hypothetical protein
MIADEDTPNDARSGLRGDGATVWDFVALKGLRVVM